MMKTFRTMLKTELKLNIRDMNMVIFAIFMPLVILIILGIIYGTKPAFDGAGYTFLEQSFGGLCAISICAGGAMGLPILVAEYRERKILKRFKVTPVSPALLLSVQVVSTPYIPPAPCCYSGLLQSSSGDSGCTAHGSLLWVAGFWCWSPCLVSA